MPVVIPPPARFSQPPVVRVVERRLPMFEVAAACGAANTFAPGGVYRMEMGCAYPAPSLCVEILPTWESWSGTRQVFEDLKRHEDAHCNGWPADHPK